MTLGRIAPGGGHSGRTLLINVSFLTARRKRITGAAVAGTPWSGHPVYQKCFIVRLLFSWVLVRVIVVAIQSPKSTASTRVICKPGYKVVEETKVCY